MEKVRKLPFIITIPASGHTRDFVAGKELITQSGGVKITAVSQDFKAMFFGKSETSLKEDISLCCYETIYDVNFYETFNLLGGKERAATPLRAAISTLSPDISGQIRMDDGRFNNFFIVDKLGILRLVTFFWRGDGFGVRAMNTKPRGGLREEERIFSPVY